MKKHQKKTIAARVPAKVNGGHEPGVTNKASASGSQVLIQGLASLIEGQRCFADEFGLTYGRVFRDEYEPFKGKNPEMVILQWLREGEEGAARLQNLLDDLLKHQLALVGALEGIAIETVDQLSPTRVVKNSPGFLGVRPFAWRSYRDLHRRYALDEQLRLKNLVINGFVSGYIREREKKS